MSPDTGGAGEETGPGAAATTESVTIQGLGMAGAGPGTVAGTCVGAGPRAPGTPDDAGEEELTVPGEDTLVTDTSKGA